MKLEWYGFCNASKEAYGSCVYICSTDGEGRSHVHLFCAKSRIALKKVEQTIPRMELYATLLLANLHPNIKSSLHIKMEETRLWSDSMIVLYWIWTPAQLLKPFVARKGAEIKNTTTESSWCPARTHDNPADIL